MCFPLSWPAGLHGNMSHCCCCDAMLRDSFPVIAYGQPVGNYTKMVEYGENGGMIK